MKEENSDYLPLVDEDGKVVGKELRSVCHNGVSMLLHPVVHLHIFNPGGALYLQKRPMHKDVQPGRWDTSVGGHVDPGETIQEALEREVMEEAGLPLENERFLFRYKWESQVERELVHTYMMITHLSPVPDPSEIDEGRFWSPAEIEDALGKGIFTPNFEYEFRILISSNVFQAFDY